MKKIKKRKTQNELPKPLLAALSYTKISLIFLAAGFGLLMLFIFKADKLGKNGIIDRVYFLLLIPFALSVAISLFKVVGAKAKFKGKVLGGILELGGSAVIFCLILLLGFKLMPDAKPFDFTIILRDAQGKTILRNKGEIKIILQNDIRTKKIDENGSVDFKSIPKGFKNSKVTVELNAPGWQFANGNVSILCTLKGTNAHMTIERDKSLCCISGTVVNEEENLVAGARVRIKDITTETDENGWFTLKIPPEKQAAKQFLTIQKEGYKTNSSFVYPASKSEIIISLTKKKKND
ncbi:hypothetical protein ACFLRT_00140 [Acidobacteriota bacterium]